MSNLIVAHWACDRGHAVGLGAVLRNAEPLEVSNEAPALSGKRQFANLVILWSEGALAGGAGGKFAAMAAAQKAAVVVCRLDDAPLSAELAALQLNAFSAESGLKKGARAAIASARKPEGGLAEGFSTGFAGSMAVLGLGGAIALGASDRAPAVLDGLADGAANLFTSGAAHASMLEERDSTGAFANVDRAGALLSEWGMRRTAADLQDVERLSAAEITARLAQVDALIAARRAETDEAIARLSALASDGARAAPRLQLASAPAAPASAPVAQVEPVQIAVQDRAAPVEVQTISAVPLATADPLELLPIGFDSSQELVQFQRGELVEFERSPLWRPGAPERS